ncbi:histidine kinase dimerization/phospho-acceptor domain-containing protein [Streptomyces humidus]|uniref:histidine kinase dimerization/phospho-acceptor domain-containing protein n=1 Tax=Streptomyces humidus TaxID=52259 RepID=UPI0027E4AE9E|nr:histidine kinase dimerization/phospho-acceptor domain-containing protein [Streptomyces humidus]
MFGIVGEGTLDVVREVGEGALLRSGQELGAFQVALRTPLTAVRLRLRLRLENFEPHLAPCAQDSLDKALGELERLSRMVQGLLALARLENSAIRPEPVDLDIVVVDRAAIWTAFADEQQVGITVSGARAVRVWAARRRR